MKVPIDSGASAVFNLKSKTDTEAWAILTNEFLPKDQKARYPAQERYDWSHFSTGHLDPMHVSNPGTISKGDVYHYDSTFGHRYIQVLDAKENESFTIMEGSANPIIKPFRGDSITDVYFEEHFGETKVAVSKRLVGTPKFGDLTISFKERAGNVLDKVFGNGHYQKKPHAENAKQNLEYVLRDRVTAERDDSMRGNYELPGSDLG